MNHQEKIILAINQSDKKVEIYRQANQFKSISNEDYHLINKMIQFFGKEEDRLLTKLNQLFLENEQDTIDYFWELFKSNSGDYERIFLGITRSYTQNAIKVASEILLENNNQLKETAAYYLYDSNSEFAVPYLIQALNSEDYNVVSNSALALGNIGDSRAEDALIKLVDKYNNDLTYSDRQLDEGPPVIRQNVFNALCLLKTEKAKIKIYESLFDDRSLQIQLRAIRFLHTDQPEDTKQILNQLINHAQPEVSTLAQNYLEELN